MRCGYAESGSDCRSDGSAAKTGAALVSRVQLNLCEHLGLRVAREKKRQPRAHGHHAVEAIETLDGVVDRVKAPERGHPVTRPVRHGDAEVEHDDRGEDLECKGPLRPRPRTMRASTQGPPRDEVVTTLSNHARVVADGVGERGASVAMRPLRLPRLAAALPERRHLRGEMKPSLHTRHFTIEPPSTLRAMHKPQATRRASAAWQRADRR